MPPFDKNSRFRDLPSGNSEFGGFAPFSVTFSFIPSPITDVRGLASRLGSSFRAIGRSDPVDMALYQSIILNRSSTCVFKCPVCGVVNQPSDHYYRSRTLISEYRSDRSLNSVMSDIFDRLKAGPGNEGGAPGQSIIQYIRPLLVYCPVCVGVNN